MKTLVQKSLSWVLLKQHVLRLQGLDGEATERMIEHLAEPASEQQEAEQEYAVARVLADQAASGAVTASIPHSHITP